MVPGKRWLNALKETLFSLGAIGIATGVSFGLDALKIDSGAILIVYLLPILAIAIVCDSIVYSILASVFIVLLYNFCFTSPRFSFAMDEPGPYISLAVYFLVSTLLFSETRSTHREIEKRKENEKRLETLGRFSAYLLEERESRAVFEALAKSISSYFPLSALVFSSEEASAYALKQPAESELAEAIRYTLASNLPSGYGENRFFSLPDKVIPIGNEQMVFGLILLPLPSKKPLSAQETSFLESLAASAANALARKAAVETSEKNRLSAENEKYKADLLRCLSHDIKTPLTALETGTSLLENSYDELSEEDRRSIVRNLNDESVSLGDYVENLLSLSKVNSLGENIPKTMEVAQDLLDEAFNGEAAFLKSHQLKCLPPEEGLLVYCDGRLIVQVLRNLIHNALIHTRADAKIRVSCAKEEGGVRFLVHDDGGGIPEDRLPRLFEEYSTLSNAPSDRLNGHGLGLSICQSIVAVHQGWIKGGNNAEGGADFDFFLPDKPKGLQ